MKNFLRTIAAPFIIAWFLLVALFDVVVRGKSAGLDDDE